MSPEQQFERSMLTSKDREELHTIASAVGVKAATRMRKADLIDAILDVANGEGKAASGASGGNGSADESDDARSRAAYVPRGLPSSPTTTRSPRWPKKRTRSPRRAPTTTSCPVRARAEPSNLRRTIRRTNPTTTIARPPMAPAGRMARRATHQGRVHQGQAHRRTILVRGRRQSRRRQRCRRDGRRSPVVWRRQPAGTASPSRSRRPGAGRRQ